MRTALFSLVALVFCAANASAQEITCYGLPTMPPASPHATHAEGDFDGDGRTDLALFRPYDGTWHIAFSASTYSTSSTFQFGLPGDVPLAADYTGSGVADVTVFRNGWWLRPSSGWPGDGGIWQATAAGLPLTGDFDGDGKADIGIYDGGYWVIHLSSKNYYVGPAIGYIIQCQFGGAAGDIPVPADYDGDGRADLAIYNVDTGAWRVAFARSNYSANDVDTFQDVAGGTPAPADYDGDGVADRALWMGEAGTPFHLWSVHLSASHADIAVPFGDAWDVPLPGDYDGDGRTDMALFRPATGTVYINLAVNDFMPSSSYAWGMNGDISAVGNSSNNAVRTLVHAGSDVLRQSDFDGDGYSDISIYRPSTGEWFMRQSLWWTSWSRSVLGLPGDRPVPGDYNRDGRTEPAVFRASTGEWIASGFTDSVIWGSDGDTPVPGDYDGEGTTDIAFYHPADHGWYIRFTSSTSPFVPFARWGLDGDIPVPADYDGDGRTDIAVFRPVNGTWYILQSSQNFAPLEIQFGLAGDIPVPGDYAGIGRAQPAVYRPSAGLWYTFPDRIRATQWGLPGDVPVVGDFDGDGRIDCTIYRPSVGLWYVLMSRFDFTTYFVLQWGGQPGDVPIPPAK